MELIFDTHEIFFFSAQLANTEIEDMENNLIGILGVTSELGIMQLIMIYSFEHLYKLELWKLEFYFITLFISKVLMCLWRKGILFLVLYT